jgi:hypothetical protein
MNAEQFAWAFLIKNGSPDTKSSYYGGREPISPYAKKIMEEYSFGDQRKEFYLNLIKTHGVNWSRTYAPSSDTESHFLGTFCDPEQREVMIGDLVLNNGQTIHWVSDTPTTDVFKMMADMSKLEEFAKEVLCLETKTG